VCYVTGGFEATREVQRTQLSRQLMIIIEPWEHSGRMYPEKVTIEKLGGVPEVILGFGLGGECDYTVDLSDLEVWPREATYSGFAPVGVTRWTGCEVEGTISIELPTGDTRSVDVPYSMDETDEEIAASRAPQEAQEAPCGYMWLKPLLHLMADVWGDDFLAERDQVLYPLLGEVSPPDNLDPTRPVPAQDNTDSFLDLLDEVIAERAAAEGAREQATEPSTDRAAGEPTPGTPSLGDTLTRSVDGMVMVYVPAGEFEIGSGEFAEDLPVHTVALDGFWIDQTEVTSAQYAQCVTEGECVAPYDEPGCAADGDDHPVVCVSWHNAADYCAWAGARLPTEEEWESAARGPEESVFPWGDTFDGTLLNYCDVNCESERADEEFDDGYARTAPVGSYPEGAGWCGALDLAGNVWEWVRDWRVPVVGENRVLRGGSWADNANAARGGTRFWLPPDAAFEFAGFRCARDS
jgi:formylglycine-generating enzyme required for sulfatase activity